MTLKDYLEIRKWFYDLYVASPPSEQELKNMTQDDIVSRFSLAIEMFSTTFSFR